MHNRKHCKVKTERNSMVYANPQPSLNQESTKYCTQQTTDTSLTIKPCRL